MFVQYFFAASFVKGLFIENIRKIVVRKIAVRKIIQLLHVTMDNLQVPYRILRAGDLESANTESLALHAMISLILLPFTKPHWSRFYSFHGLMGLCNIKNPKWRKCNGFNICEIIKSVFMSFDMNYFSVMRFL